MNERKKQVLLTAKRIFIEKGFAATSVQDILEESKISKGTFYNYFSTKNECLMAILEHGRDETIIRRQELIVGQSKSDKDILAKQVSIRLLVNRDQNLLPIIEAVFYSGDPDLRTFAKKHHLSELSWLTNRLVDIYGDDAIPFAQECAILMMGMMQHTIHVWAASLEEEIDAIELITFVIRRMDSVMADLFLNPDRLLPENIFKSIELNAKQNKQTKMQLLLELQGFYKVLEDDVIPSGRQYVEFILNEMELENPRVFLLETVFRSFREAFIDTSHELEARELASRLWKYLEYHKRTTNN